MVDIDLYDDALALLETSRDHLERHEAEHCLSLGILERLAAAPKEKHHHGHKSDPLLLRATQSGRTIGVAVRTPPKNLVLSRFDADAAEAMRSLARGLIESGIDVPGVIGPAEEADAFAAAWMREGRAAGATVETEQGVYELRELNEITYASGSFRELREADLELLLPWMTDFSQAVGDPKNEDQATDHLKRCFVEHTLFLWDNGGPVSMASSTRATRHGITVNGVYTPPSYRNHGYGTSCVHSLTKLLLERGHTFCTLYTDLANPTSNAIYKRIGYRRIGDSRVYSFTA